MTNPYQTGLFRRTIKSICHIINYYIIHIYLIHLFATIAFFIRGNHTVQEAYDSVQKVPFLFVMPGEGVGLALTYAIWAGIIMLLYPLCKWYDRYKTSHKEKWWLSYL